MRIVGKILAVLALLAVLAAVGIFYFLRASDVLISTADEFFSALRSGDMEGAYGQVSEDFRQGTSQAELRAYMARHSLEQFKNVRWHGPAMNFNNGVKRGVLTGSFESETGTTFPLTLRFIKEAEAWRIYALNKVRAGAETKNGWQLPNDKEVTGLVNETMRVFASSVKAKSMAEFHKYVAVLWQRHHSAEKLDKFYGVFFEKQIDLTGLRSLSPAFDKKPLINDDGVLIAEGHYPARPSRVDFKASYMYEGLGWKLTGLTVNVKPVKGAKPVHKIPADDRLRRMVNDTTMVFARSVNARSMAGLHKHAADRFRRQFTIAKLDKAFETFYKSGDDLTLLSKYRPDFLEKPRIDREGVLVVKGRYPTKPDQVLFRQRYIFENGDWKLFGLNVLVKPNEG